MVRERGKVKRNVVKEKKQREIDSKVNGIEERKPDFGQEEEMGHKKAEVDVRWLVML